MAEDKISPELYASMCEAFPVNEFTTARGHWIVTIEWPLVWRYDREEDNQYKAVAALGFSGANGCPLAGLLKVDCSQKLTPEVLEREIDKFPPCEDFTFVLRATGLSGWQLANGELAFRKWIEPRLRWGSEKYYFRELEPLFNKKFRSEERADIELADYLTMNSSINSLLHRLGEHNLRPLLVAESFSYGQWAALAEERSVASELCRNWPLFATTVTSDRSVKIMNSGRTLEANLTIAAIAELDKTRLVIEPSRHEISVAKRFKGLKPSDFLDAELTTRQSSSYAFSVLAALPLDWFPKDDAERRAFWRVTRLLYAVNAVVGNEGSAGIRRLAEPCKGRWVDWERSLIGAFAGYHFEADAKPAMLNDNFNKLAKTSITDMARAFSEQVLAPVVARNFYGNVDNADALVNPVLEGDRPLWILFSGITLKKVLEATVKWHINWQTMLTAMHIVTPDLTSRNSWSAVLPTLMIEYEGRAVKCVPLTSLFMLAEEGSPGNDVTGMAGLDHCIASYASSCAQGYERIVALREVLPDRMKRLTSAEISVGFEGDDVKLTVMQHRGKRNRVADEFETAVLERYVSIVQSGEFDGKRPVPSDFPKDDRTHRPDRRATMSSVCGYDNTDQANIEKVLRIWDMVIPRPLRGLSVDEFSNRAGLTALRRMKFVAADNTQEARMAGSAT